MQIQTPFLLLVFNIITLFANSQDSVSRNECTNYGLVKGMYINQFLKTKVTPPNNLLPDFKKSILGNPAKENALLFYAKQNAINYLVLYDVYPLFCNFSNNTAVIEYRKILGNFIKKANAENIEIGLVFDPDFINRSSHYQLTRYSGMSVSKEQIIQKLNYDTLFKGWAQLSRLMATIPHPELSINKEIYALISISQFNNQLIKQNKGKLMQGSIGISSLITECEWWNSHYERPEVAFSKKFIPMLQAMNAIKQMGSIKRIEVYQGRFPGNDSSSYDMEIYKNWVSRMTPYIDRLLLVNYTRFISDIGNSEHFKLQLELFNSTNNKNPNLEFMPLFACQTDKFIDYGSIKLSHYSNYLGNILSNGGAEGKSIQEIQTLFYNRYEELRMQGKTGNRIKLAGFQWFEYTLSPLMIYNTDSIANKFRSPHYLTQKLVNYFPDTIPINLEIYNAKRSPFGTGTSTDNYGNRYYWFKTNTDFTEEPLEIGSNSVILSVNESGVYFVKTIRNGCSTVSVPVQVRFGNK